MAATVLRAEDYRVAAVLWGWLEPHRIASALVRLAKRYVWQAERPLVAIEKGGPGGAVLTNLRDTDIRLYGRNKKSLTAYSLGWSTDASTRSIMFNEVRRLASKFWLRPMDRELLTELVLLQLDERSEVRALGGDREDMSVSLAIACAIRREIYGHYPMPLPEEAASEAPLDPRTAWIYESERTYGSELRQDVVEEFVI